MKPKYELWFWEGTFRYDGSHLLFQHLHQYICYQEFVKHSGVEIRSRLQESYWILINLCKNLVILLHSYTVYSAHFTRIYLDSLKIF